MAISAFNLSGFTAPATWALAGVRAGFVVPPRERVVACRAVSHQPAEPPSQPEPVLPRIAAGDPDAVEACLERYKGLVWWLARQHAGPDAEDAVQEIFIDLWSSAGRYDPKLSSEPAFVALIARRRLIDRRRRLDRRPSEQPLETELGEWLGSDGQVVEDAAEIALATRALRQLKPEERRAVWLSVYHGLTHSEIANHTQMPLGTVKTYVRRGLMRVREALGRRSDEPGGEVSS